MKLNKMESDELLEIYIAVKDILSSRGWEPCHCGMPLPLVDDDEIPYEFCSQRCKNIYGEKK